MSTDHKSMVGRPSIIHSARYFPAPPELAMPMELKPVITNRFPNSGVSPMSQLLSGVKLSGPLTNFSNPHFSSAGIRQRPAAKGSWYFSQSGSNSLKEKSAGILSTHQGLVNF